MLVCICVEFGTFNRQDVNIRVILSKTYVCGNTSVHRQDIQPNVAAGIVALP